MVRSSARCSTLSLERSSHFSAGSMTVSGSSNRTAATSERTRPRPSEIFCLASAVRRLALRPRLRHQVEQLGDLADTRLDRRPLHAAISEREGQVLAHRHGVVDHRELEHLGDVALPGAERHDIAAVEQDPAPRRPHDAGDDVEQRGLAAARRPEQGVGAALAPGHRCRLQREARGIGAAAAVGVREIDEVDAGHGARPQRPAAGAATSRPSGSKTKRSSGSSAASRAGPAETRERPAARRPSCCRRARDGRSFPSRRSR